MNKANKIKSLSKGTGKLFTMLFSLVVTLISVAVSVFLFVLRVMPDSDPSEEDNWTTKNSYMDWESQYTNQDNIWNQNNK